MSSSYIYTADPVAATSVPANITAVNTSIAQQAEASISDDHSFVSQSNGQNQKHQLPQTSTNMASFVANGLNPMKTTSLGDLSSVSHFPTSAKEILKRASENANVVSGSPAWEAAREQVLKSMAVSNHTLSPLPIIRSRGRGRPPSNSKVIHIHQVARPPAPAVTTTVTNGEPFGSNAHVKRGRGRGRARGSRGSMKGRGGKRKREDDTEGSLSEDDSEISDSYTPLTTVTKSGRNVTKPLQFTPAADISPDGDNKRRRSYRRGPEFTLCSKCERGHSPLSNAIVFCDGCNSAYHQWCHDPHIPKEVVEIAEMSWFCGKCHHKKEMEGLPMDERVSGEGLSIEERLTYLSTLSSTTLKSLLIKAVELHPALPVFARNTREVIKGKSSHLYKSGSIPSPPVSQASSIAPRITTTTTNISYPEPSEPQLRTGDEPEDPYPDYSNPAGDPPATYPRPGHGPIKIRATTDPEDLPWLLDDNFEVFSHLIDDGSGNLVPVNRNGEWVGKQTKQEEIAATEVAVEDVADLDLIHGLPLEEQEEEEDAEQQDSVDFHSLTVDDMEVV